MQLLLWCNFWKPVLKFVPKEACLVQFTWYSFIYSSDGSYKYAKTGSWAFELWSILSSPGCSTSLRQGSSCHRKPVLPSRSRLYFFLFQGINHPAPPPSVQSIFSNLFVHFSKILRKSTPSLWSKYIFEHILFIFQRFFICFACLECWTRSKALRLKSFGNKVR